MQNSSVWDFTLLSLRNCVKKTANQFHSQCSRSRRQVILTSDTCWLLLPIMPDARESDCRNNSVDGAIKLVKILEVCCAWFSASSNSHHKQNSDTYSFFVNFLTSKEMHINSMESCILGYIAEPAPRLNIKRLEGMWMKSEINMISIYNNTSLLDPTTRLHYSLQGKTICTACPVPCSTLGNSPVIRKNLVSLKLAGILGE